MRAVETTPDASLGADEELNSALVWPVLLVPPVSHSSVKVATVSAGGADLTNGVLAFLIHVLPLIMFGWFHSGSFPASLLLRGGRKAGGRAAGHSEQEQGKTYRRHNGHGTSLILTVLGVPK
jgi:hypothetical protein